MSTWDKDEFEAMRLADEEIEREFAMTLDEINESRDRDSLTKELQQEQ